MICRCGQSVNQRVASIKDKYSWLLPNNHAMAPIKDRNTSTNKPRMYLLIRPMLLSMIMRVGIKAVVSMPPKNREPQCNTRMHMDNRQELTGMHGMDGKVKDVPSRCMGVNMEAEVRKVVKGPQ